MYSLAQDISYTFSEAYFKEIPFIISLYFLALLRPSWTRHIERRLLRFGFDVLKS